MTKSVVKKIIIFTLVFHAGLFGAVTRAAGQLSVDPNLPPWISKQPPDDTLWGIGTANLVNRRYSMDLAEIRARSELVIQLLQYPDMDFARTDDAEFNDLYEVFMAYLGMEASFEIMDDTRVEERWEGPDGSVWCLVSMNKTDAERHLHTFENLAKEYHKDIFGKR